MKNRGVFLLLTLFTVVIESALGQQSYESAMQAALTQLKSPSSADDTYHAAQRFERIAQAKPEEWLPVYWGAYAYVLVAQGRTEKNKKDSYLDHAEALLKRAEALQPANDEVVVLRIYLTQAQLAVSYDRWDRLRPVMLAGFERARTLNSQNPRLLFLEGRTVARLPESMGGSRERGCALVKQAIDQFAQVQPASPFHPDWGLTEARTAYSKCSP